MDLRLDLEPPQIYLAIAKGGSDGYVPILPALAQELRTHLSGRKATYLFESNRHAPYTPHAVQLFVRDAAKRAGLAQRVTPHRLRGARTLGVQLQLLQARDSTAIDQAFVEAGGLMSYGPSPAERGQRLADYVDKILNGAKPGDLPIEQLTTFEFVINLKTAQALGLMVPPMLLFQAPAVIR